MDEEEKETEASEDETDPIAELLIDIRDKVDDIGTRVYGEEKFDLEEENGNADTDGKSGDETTTGEAPTPDTPDSASGEIHVVESQPDAPRQADHKPNSPHWYFRKRFNTGN